ncbi:hypothetical protein RZE82_08340 [Mollicutes bacterium LVI A0039]|nr:hypothetical protein RZE82_08340 [Mollicutes bacterium LVI A0039]
MKLHYLKEVQVMLDNYDFQDKYKILLDLENFITKYEKQAINDPNIIITKLGTPDQFVARVVKKYNLEPLTDTPNPTTTNPDTEDLLSAVSPDQVNQEHTESITLDMEPINSEHDHNLEPEQTNSVHLQSRPLKQPFNNPAKQPFIVLFKIISVLFAIFSLVVVSLAIVIAVAMLLVIDIQVAISFFLGILLAITAGHLTISSIKNFVLGVLDNDLKVKTIMLKVIVVMICVLISGSLVSSSIDKVTIYVTGNIELVQDVLNSLNVDFSDVDWQNLDLNEYMKLGIDVGKSYLNR